MRRPTCRPDPLARGQAMEARARRTPARARVRRERSDASSGSLPFEEPRARLHRDPQDGFLAEAAAVLVRDLGHGPVVLRSGRMKHLDDQDGLPDRAPSLVPPLPVRVPDGQSLREARRDDLLEERRPVRVRHRPATGDVAAEEQPVRYHHGGGRVRERGVLPRGARSEEQSRRECGERSSSAGHDAEYYSNPRTTPTLGVVAGTSHPVVVVGAGAAGTMAAIFAAESGRRVLLLETTPNGGPKIVISGGGRSN